MNIKATFFFLIILHLSKLTAQNNEMVLFPYLIITQPEEESKWGYMDMELAKWGYMDITGKTIIKPQFSFATEFSDGFAVIQLLERKETENSYKVFTKWGVINQKGEIIIECKFGQISKFSNALAKAALPELSFFNKNYKELKKQTRSGYIDCTGTFIIPWELNDFKFNMAGDFSEGLARVAPALSYKDAKEIIQDKKLLETFAGIFGDDENQKVYSSNNPYGFINREGKLVVENKFDYVGDFHEGLAFAKLYGEKQFGFIDKKGEFVIRAQYENIGDFSEGLAAVAKDGKWGFIDKSNNLRIKHEYSYAEDFNGGFAAVKLNDKYGFVTKDGDLIIKANYDRAGSFSNGLAAVGKKEGYKYQWGFINEKGKLIVPFQYTGYEAPLFKNGLALVQITIKEPSENEWNKGEMINVNKHGYINTKGDWVYGPIKGPWDTHLN